MSKRKAVLAEIMKKSAIQLVTELAASFDSKDEYLKYLEGVALIAFKDALCNVDDRILKITFETAADQSYGRAAAFLLMQELEIQRRTNIAVCGRQIPTL